MGASTRSTAIELRDIEYVTLDWQNVGINVGDSSESPAYLTLNTDLVEIYNANFDDTSLTFSSSSAIESVTLKDVYKQNADGTFTVDTDSHSAYYINKFGSPTDLSTSVLNTISATAEQNVLNGAISILSPIVPATQAEIDEQIAALPKPPVPTLSEPTYNGTIPTAPPVVNQPTNKPNPDDYVRNSSTSNGTGRTIEDVEESHQVQERTVTRTSYGYTTNADGSISFYTYTETATQTRRREWEQILFWYDWGSWSDWSPNTNSLTWSEKVATADTSTQNSWNNAITQYNDQVADYEEYLKKLAQYEADMAELNKKPEYQQYLADKAAYDAAWATYNAELAEYNKKVEEIRNSGGEETHYNTIRYLEFEVTNADGLTATFRVMQYPVIYITNVMGSYSYRDDFINSNKKVVTYILWKNNDNSTNNYTRCSYDSDNEKWNYYTGNNSQSLFCSKYVYSTSTSGSNQGKSRIDYYYWDYGSNSVSTGHTEVWSENVTDNARMYHVQVTATSGEYIVGRPRFIDENGNPTSNVENGYTEDSAENAKLVSPSFMIASQLGATQSPGIKDEYMPVAADHCRQYVEVAADGTEYHDWRLPTAAEIDIIIKLQNNSQAMDEVLSGRSYWSASGIKNTGLGADNETGRIRCVRDAY